MKGGRDADEPRAEDGLSTEITGVTAIKNQEDICLSSFQVALDQAPAEVAVFRG